MRATSTLALFQCRTERNLPGTVQIQNHIYFLSYLFTMIVITIYCMSQHTDTRYRYNKSIRHVPMLYLNPIILVYEHQAGSQIPLRV